MTHDYARLRSSTVVDCPQKSICRKPLVFKAGNVPIKIYQGNWRGYSRFTVAYYVAGRRMRQAFANLADARARAQEIVDSIIKNQLGALELSNVDRDRYAMAVELLKPLDMPLHLAVQEYVAARAQLNGQSLLSAIGEYVARRRTVVDKRVREIAAELVAIKQNDGLSRRYIQTLRHHVNKFAAAFETNIGSVTAGLIDDWLRALNLGARGRNNIRMSIVTLFHFARARGYLPKGQSTEAEDVPKAKERGGKIGILAPKQLADLFERAEEEAKLYFALGAFTGIRSAELIRLEWHDVNFARGHIEVGKEKAKTATRRLVPISSNLMEWLAPYNGRQGLIFSSPRAAERSIALAKETISPWPSNALRHSYATYRLAQCHDAARVALEMGNSPQMLFRNYRELADEQDAAAWFSIAPEKPENVIDVERFPCAPQA